MDECNCVSPWAEARTPAGLERSRGAVSGSGAVLKTNRLDIVPLGTMFHKLYPPSSSGFVGLRCGTVIRVSAEGATKGAVYTIRFGVDGDTEKLTHEELLDGISACSSKRERRVSV